MVSHIHKKRLSRSGPNGRASCESACRRKNFRGFRFPAKIADFRFEKALLTDKRNTSYRYGLYRDENGKSAFAKVLPKRGSWSRRGIDTERAAYDYLRKATCRRPEIAKMFPHMHVPEMFAFEENDESIVLLLENLPWKPLQGESFERKKDAYRTVLRYFRYLGNADGTVKVRTRTLSYWMLMMSLNAVRAILRHPESSHLVVVGSFACLLWSVLALFTRRGYVLAHGDLGEWNILVRDGEIAIIDFELASITFPAYDSATIGLGHWEALRRVGKAGGETDLDFLISDNEKNEFYAMAVHLAICNLGIPDGKSPIAVRSYLAYGISRWFGSVVGRGRGVTDKSL